MPVAARDIEAPNGRRHRVCVPDPGTAMGWYSSMAQRILVATGQGLDMADKMVCAERRLN